jgi:hypothetical protein
MKVTLALDFFENFYYNIIPLVITNSGVDTIPFINSINFWSTSILVSTSTLLPCISYPMNDKYMT